jgi:hypothetical protein
MSNWTVPSHVVDPGLQKQFIDNLAKSDNLKTEAGLVGIFIGTRFAATNIAAIICIASILLIAADLILNVPDVLREHILQASVTTISACLGYIFGANKNK